MSSRAVCAVFTIVLGVTLLSGALGSAQSGDSAYPRWWAKYQHLLANGIASQSVASNSLSAGGNADASNECGPQSETYITVNPAAPAMLAAGSNEIFRLPMRGYSSTDGGATWTGVDLPLPPAIGKNGICFGSDPSLAFDTAGNLFYGYIVVFFSAGNGINGTEVAVARSTDGGRSYPFANFFSFEGGENHFNDKPIITADTNPSSPFRNHVYIAWDAAAGGSGGGGVRLARSADHGATFSISRIDNPKGPGRSIGAVPFIGPDGSVYAAWNDYSANQIVFNRSFDGGASWDTPRTLATKSIPFAIAVPAESFRGALVYPSCDADRSSGPHRGRLYCSWMDLTQGGETDILLSFSDDRGATWSNPAAIADQLPADRFNHWLSVDPITGEANISFYDTRNDTTGFRYMTDVYFTQSNDGGASWLSPNLRVTNVSSNEHDCSGIFPCPGIDYGNQYGDYEGLVSFNGLIHPIWTDSRLQMSSATGCRTSLEMEEVFTVTIRK